MKEPALGIIEYKSIAKGIYSCDTMVKKAPIRIIATHPVCPGKYMTIIGGEVADVDEAMKAGIESGRDMVVNDLFLPYVHKSIIPAISGTIEVKEFESIGIIETFSVTTSVKAADIVAKETPVKLVEIRLANGLGGKGYFVMTGKLSDIEEAIGLAKAFAIKDGTLANAEIIASPHPQLIEKGMYW